MWKIKFNHVQDLSDARFAASAMAEWIGFAIEGPNAIHAEAIQEIIGWCAGPKLILEVHDASIDKINSLLDILPVNGIECTEDRLESLKKAFPDVSEWIVLNHTTQQPLTHSHSWEKGQHIVCVDATPENQEKILQHQPFGFSLNCQKEVEIGKKDHSQWHDFFESLDLF